MGLRPRSLAALLVLVAVVAISLAAIVRGSDFCAGVLWLITLSSLGVSLLGIAYRDGARRAWWLGFAIFGCGYARLGMAPLAIPEAYSMMPATTLIEWLKEMRPEPPPPVPQLAEPASNILKRGTDLFDANDHVHAANYLSFLTHYRDQLTSAEVAKLDDYLKRLKAIDPVLVSPDHTLDPPPRWAALLEHPSHLRSAVECWCTVLAGCFGGFLGLKMHKSRTPAATQESRPA